MKPARLWAVLVAVIFVCILGVLAVLPLFLKSHVAIRINSNHNMNAIWLDEPVIVVRCRWSETNRLPTGQDFARLASILNSKLADALRHRASAKFPPYSGSPGSIRFRDEALNIRWLAHMHAETDLLMVPPTTKWVIHCVQPEGHGAHSMENFMRGWAEVEGLVGSAILNLELEKSGWVLPK